MGYAVRRYPLLACFLYLGLAAARILPGNAHGAESGRPKIRLALSGDTLDDNAPIQNLFRTGGFRSLSGFNQNQLSVQHEGLVLLSSLSSLAEVTRVSGPLGCSPGGVDAWQAWENQFECWKCGCRMHAFSANWVANI